MKVRVVLQLAGMSLLFCAQIAFAQSTTGTISGTVRDTSGAVLPGTQVVVLNEDTGLSRTAVADSGGRYDVPSLNLGNYRVTGKANGFQTAVRTGILLTVGREALVDLVLEVGSVSQTVEVTGEASILESTSASLGSLVDDRTLRELPLNGRSYDQLALLQPGVAAIDAGSNPGGTLFLFGSGKRFSVGGARSYGNNFLLDGTNINDQGNGTGGGASGTNLGVDTILEFKIFTNSFKAEYGRAVGSVLTSVTRSGTNVLHGTAFEYIRNSVLDARNFFDVGSSLPPFRRNQFGGVLGGPIKKDKTFIFGGYEGLRQGLGTTQIADVPTTLAKEGILPTGTVPVNPVVVPFLKLYPTANGRDFGNGIGEFISAPTVVTNEDNFMVRVDHQLNAKTGIFSRYQFDHDSVNAPQSLPNLFVITAARRQYTTLQGNSILGPKALNNIRFAFNRTSSQTVQNFIPDPGPQVSLIPGQPVGAISIGALGGSTGITPIGASGGKGLQTWAYNNIETGDDFSYVAGKHSLKTGVDIERIQDNNARGLAVRGSYTFPTFTAFLAGTPSNLAASSPLGVTPEWGLRQTLFAVYGQDDYTVNSRLTLNLGLRWEFTTDPKNENGQMSILPSPASTHVVISDKYFALSKKNIEPRLGIAWRLNDSGKTVLRTGGGIYHNQVLPYLYQSQTNLPPFLGNYNLNNPPFPNGYQLLNPSNITLLKIMSSAQKTPVTDQYNLSIQQEVLKNTVVEIAYAGSKSNHLVTAKDKDTAYPTFIGGQPFFPANAVRRNPAWTGIQMLENDANAVYNSLTVTLRRQSSSGLQGQVFYTFSAATDGAINLSGAEGLRSPSALLDPDNRNRDWGLSELVSKHSLHANLSYPLPFRSNSKTLEMIISGWTLDSIGTFASGLPFTPRLISAVSRDLTTQSAERPDLKPGASNNPTQGTSAGCAGFPAGMKLRGADNFYDPCSFSLPLAGTFGNLGRNTVIGPKVAALDLALEKNFLLHEMANVTFKAEIFNILNHANFGLPNTGPVTATGTASASGGRVTYTATSSRQLQFALRISF